GGGTSLFFLPLLVSPAVFAAAALVLAIGIVPPSGRNAGREPEITAPAPTLPRGERRHGWDQNFFHKPPTLRNATSACIALPRHGTRDAAGLHILRAIGRVTARDRNRQAQRFTRRRQGRARRSRLPHRPADV